ncbi:MAG: hypothetical protein AAB724_03070 [Patescibacteria group bacterium]
MKFAYQKKEKRFLGFQRASGGRGVRQPFPWRIFFASGFFVFFLVGGLYFFLVSPVFELKKLEVEGENAALVAQAKSVAEAFWLQPRFKYLAGNNFFLFSARTLIEKIKQACPEADRVAVGKDLMTGVKINVSPRLAAAIWCQSAAVVASVDQATTTDIALLPSDECFFADNNGLLFREAPAISGTALPTFFGQIDQDFGVRSQAIASSTIQFATQLKKQLWDIDIDPIGFTVNVGDSQEITVFTDESWLVYFDLNRQVQPQVKILGVLLANDLKDKREILKYIDLRVAGKVYYK